LGEHRNPPAIQLGCRYKSCVAGTIYRSVAQLSLKGNSLRAIQLCFMSTSARLPTFFSANSRVRSSSELSSENTLFMSRACFRNALTISSLPRGVRATFRTRLFFGALDPADETFRDEAVDSDANRAWSQINDWAYYIHGQRPLVQQDFQYAEIREAEPGLVAGGLRSIRRVTKP
jgi:hypothetical protein